MLKKLIISSVLFSMLITPGIADTSAQTELNAIADKAYLYAFPLVLMNKTMEVLTNVPAPDASSGRPLAPPNQFGNMTAFPEPNIKEVIRPNADTLYSSAWLDLSKEPIIFSVPDSNDRYYLMPMLDAWTNVFTSPGKRTTGTKAANFAIVGPNWQGTLPNNTKKIAAPTDIIWIIGRIQTNGIKDYPAVHQFQDQLKLTPLSAWGKEDYMPPIHKVKKSIDMITPPPIQVAIMDGVTFFKTFNDLLKTNPPQKTDTQMISQLKKIGIEPGQDFDETKLTFEQKSAMNQAQKHAMEQIKQELSKANKPINGWIITRKNVGTYGNDYRARAAVALYGLGANLPQDAIYPYTSVNGQGQQLTGVNNYILHFSKNNLPPANAFWSLTMYDKDGYFIKNPINRNTIGSRDKLQFNKDGSLDIYLQNDSPGKDKESNWLPSPKDDFNVLLRLYWPKEIVLNGHWAPPGLRNVTEMGTKKA